MEEKKEKPKLFGEYMEELGICTADQVSAALEYCAACNKRSTYLSIGQALGELGYTTQDKIEEVLRIQAKDRAAGGPEDAEASEPAEAGEPAEASEPGEVVQQDVAEARLEEKTEAEPVEDVEEWDILTPEQAEQSGLFTPEQVREAMHHCAACSKIRRYLSLGEALVELGYATRDDIDEIMGTRVGAEGPTEGVDMAKMAQALTDAEQMPAAAEAARSLGLCTADELEDALGYCSDCAKRRRHLSLAQALIELGYATEESIDEALNPPPPPPSHKQEEQPRDKQPGTTDGGHPGFRRDIFRRPHRHP